MSGTARCRVCGKELPLPPWPIIEGSLACIEHDLPTPTISEMYSVARWKAHAFNLGVNCMTAAALCRSFELGVEFLLVAEEKHQIHWFPGCGSQCPKTGRPC